MAKRTKATAKQFKMDIGNERLDYFSKHVIISTGGAFQQIKKKHQFTYLNDKNKNRLGYVTPLGWPRSLD